MQILKKFIGNDQVDESKILFSNDADFRAESAVSGELNLFKANTSDQLEFGIEVNAGAFKIRNMADPVSAQDAATKNYVDLLANGVSWKNAVLVATTGNITLSGEQTIDGVLTSASRVLVKNQSAPAQNGIYVSAAGAWSRSSDMDAWSEVPAAAVFVQSGTANADIGYVCTSQPGGTLGTTAISFVQFSSSNSYTADNVTLQLIGNQFSVKNLGISNAQIANATIDLTSKVTGALPIANGGTGQTSASAAFNALSPLTTKGDLLGYSTVNARLPVGTNNFVLTADSTQTLGVKWAAAPSTPANGPSGAVQYSDGSGNFLSDDASFHWDDSTKSLSIGIAPVPGSGVLTIDGDNGSGAQLAFSNVASASNVAFMAIESDPPALLGGNPGDFSIFTSAGSAIQMVGTGGIFLAGVRDAAVLSIPNTNKSVMVQAAQNNHPDYPMFAVGDGGFAGGGVAPSFVGYSSGTYIGVNASGAAPTLTPNLIDLQVAGVSQFCVSPVLLTSTLGAGYASVLTGSTSGTFSQSAADTTTDYSIKWPAAQATGVQVLRNDGSGNLSWATASSGSVTSVALADGSSTPIYSISGSPVTSSGTLTFSLQNQSANRVFAGPASGGAAQPTFRALVAADMPDLSGLYANVTLSNLSAPTAINADLNFTNSGGALRSPNNAGNTGHVDVLTGNSTLANSHSGQLNIKTGNANSAANQDSGDIVINTGFATNQVGSFNVQIGNGGGASTGGNITLFLGADGSGGPGFISLNDHHGGEIDLTNGVVTIIGPNDGASIQLQDGSQGTAGQVWTSTDSTGFGHWAALPASSTPAKELVILSPTDISNQYVQLSNLPLTDSVDFLVKGGGVQIEGASYDYTVDYVNNRIIFQNDLATGGVSELVSGDVVVVKYQY